jgi:hypothetical protein
MKNAILTALLILSAAPALAGPYENLDINTGTQRAVKSVSGYVKVAASAASSNTYTVTLDGPTGSVVATGSSTASSFFGAGDGLYRVPAAQLIGAVPMASVDLSTVSTALATKLSSGPVPANFVDLSTVTTALALKLAKAGDSMSGALIMVSTNIQLSGSGGFISSASSVTAATFFGASDGLSRLPAAQLIGAVPTASVNLSTVATAMATKLSSGAIPTNFVDLSTVTTALATKLSSGAIPTNFVDLSTVTTALSTKLSSGAVPTNFVDLSTVTTALNLKATDSLVVHLAGAETITGAKDLRTISSSMAVAGAFSASTTTLSGSLLVATTIQVTGGGVSINAPNGQIAAASFSGTNAALIGVNSAAVSTISGDVTLEPGGAGSSPTGLRVSGTGKNVTVPYGLAAGTLAVSGSATVSTLTVTGSGFSVGGSSFVVAAGNIGIGTSGPAQKLHISSGVLYMDGTSPALVIGSTRLPNNGAYALYGPSAGIQFDYTTSQAASRRWTLRNDSTAFGDLCFGQSTTQTGATFADKACFDASGKMGVGTASPETTLETAGSFKSGTTAWPTSLAGISAGRAALTGASANAYLILHDDTAVAANTGPGGILFTGRTSASAFGYLGSIQFLKENASDNDASSYLSIKTAPAGASGTSPTEKVRVTSDGRVGIGVSGPCSTCTLHVAGTGNFTGALRQGSIVSCATGVQTDADGKFSACVASDKRLKTGVANMAAFSPRSIDLLRPVSYRWRNTQDRDARRHIGFVAQEVEKLYPDAVVSAGKGVKGIDSNAMIAVLVQEIQALRKRVAALEAAQ